MQEGCEGVTGADLGGQEDMLISVMAFYHASLILVGSPLSLAVVLLV